MITFLHDFVTGAGGINEYPLVRACRTVVMAALAAGVTVAIELLPGIDFPGEWDALLITLGTGALTGADKWLRKAPPPA